MNDWLELALLGDLSATTASSDGTRQLGKGKPVALLAYLSASPGRRASRERLATLLWSEGSSEQARQNLRQTLWYIRRRLGNWLRSSDDIIELAPGVTSDRDGFLAAVREQRLRDAVSLYRGEFIPDFAAPGSAEFEEWAEIERRRLRGVFIGCCDTLARQALSAGQFAAAVDLARRARDEAPTELSTWRLLLESLIAARDWVAVLAEVEHCEAVLRAHDLASDDALRATLRSARAAAGASGGSTRGAEPSGAETQAAEGGAGLAPELIGRETEFRTLIERWEQAREGKGGALLLTGIAGLGKSRLLADFQARLRAQRVRVLLIRANPGDRAVGSGFLAAVAEELAKRPGARAVSSESAGVLVALAPALSSIYSGATPDAALGEDALRRRVGALLDLLRAVTDESPIAVLIDDLHWADAESRRVLDAMAARVDAGRALMVFAARPPVDALGGFAALPRMELPRFDLQRVAEFVARLGELPGDAWTLALPSQLLSASQGVPLTLIELLQRLVESEALALVDHRWSSPNPGRIEAILRDGMVVESRLSSLAAGTRELLLTMAVLGRPVAESALLALGGVARADGPDRRLLELEQRGFVARAEGTLSVAHDEIAAAALALASDAERRGAHERAAQLLLGGERSDAELRVAVQHALRSGETALERRVVIHWIERRRREGDTASARLLLVELLGAEGTPEQRRQLEQLVPWSARPSPWLWRGVAIAAGGLLMALAAQQMSPSRPPDVELFLREQAGEGRLLRVEVSDINAWEVGEPLRAELASNDALPEVLADPRARTADIAIALPDGSGWVGTSFFSDSGGSELVLTDADGRASRPASQQGDDGSVTVSPDGQQILWSSARWHPRTDRYNLTLLDRRTGVVTRWISSDDLDASARWSPDGSRVAFQRRYFTANLPHQLCVAHADGSHVDCDWPIAESIGSVSLWLDERHVVVVGLEDELVVVNVDDRSAVSLGRSVGSHYGIPGTPLIFTHSSAATSGEPTVTLARLEGRIARRPVLLNGRPVQATLVAVRSHRRARSVDRVEARVPPEGVAVDQTHRLSARVFDATGSPVVAGSLSFASLDDSVAAVVDGVLRPRRQGRVRVVASAGGWRADTQVVRIGPSNADVVLNERWDDGWQSRWRSYGDPMPFVDRRYGEASLAPNGDGKYPSGAYLRRELDPRRGIGFELRLRIPLTALNQWQGAGTAILGATPLTTFDPWDHRSGAPPEPRRLCTLSLAGEGAYERNRVALGVEGNGQETVSAPPDFFDGSWHTVRVQLFPDGRCMAALDGHPVIAVASAAALEGPSVLSLFGHSVETDVRFGSLELWTGVKGGVDWAALESAQVTATTPR